MPRELRDLVYQYALVTDTRIYDCYLIGNGSLFDKIEELATMRNILIACRSSSQLAHEACEIFFAHKDIHVEPCHLHEVLGSRSLPGHRGPPLNFMVWIQNITLDVWGTTMEVLRSIDRISVQGAPELHILLACPNLRRLTIDILWTDRLGERGGLADLLVTMTEVCKALRRKIGSGLKIRRLGWDYECEPEDLTWFIEASDGPDLKGMTQGPLLP